VSHWDQAVRPRPFETLGWAVHTGMFITVLLHWDRTDGTESTYLSALGSRGANSGVARVRANAVGRGWRGLTPRGRRVGCPL